MSDVVSNQGRIKSLIDEEHALRGTPGSGSAEKGTGRLGEVEAQLDQCWDLLRQRRAKKDFGENPDEAETRPVSEVEGYKQ